MKIRVLGEVEKKWAGELAWRVKPFTTMKLHVRCIIRDRQAAFVGSQSLRKLELDERREVGLITRDQRTVRRMAGIFDADWKSATATSRYRGAAVALPAGRRRHGQAEHASRCPPVDSTVIVPFMAVTQSSTMARPRPTPVTASSSARSAWARVKRRKIRAMRFAGMPMPLSRTQISTLPSGNRGGDLDDSASPWRDRCN